jgi:RES domain-containing protein
VIRAREDRRREGLRVFVGRVAEKHGLPPIAATKWTTAAGARWNPPGSVHTVYASLDVETAVAESLQHFRFYGIPVSKAMPRVLVALEAKLERVSRRTLRPGSVRSRCAAPRFAARRKLHRIDMGLVPRLPAGPCSFAPAQGYLFRRKFSAVTHCPI